LPVSAVDTYLFIVAGVAQIDFVSSVSSLNKVLCDGSILMEKVSNMQLFSSIII